MTCVVIATGSQGNAVSLGGEILIDCGVPYKKIAHLVPTLKLVLLTHRHGDHFNPTTIKRLHLARPMLRFGCCSWMVPYLISAGVASYNIDIYTIGDDAPFYKYGERFKVIPFPLFHDVENCGYKITYNREKILYATDTYTLDHVTAHGFDLYLIEANHTQADIEERAAAKQAAGEYAYEVQAAKNHLSQEQALDWIYQNIGTKGQYVFLHGHTDKKEDADRGEPETVHNV